MEELSQRKEAILKAVVVEHVKTAEPVGSKAIAERYSIGIGPAMIRHELADMSERGYLEQPYTSAGRIPSDIGYRYYVNRLLEPVLPAEAQRRVREVLRGEKGVNELLVETCSLLSRLTHYVAAAYALREQSSTIRYVFLSGISSQKVLITVVYGAGIVENRIIDATSDTTLQDIHYVSKVLEKLLVNRTIRAVSRMSAPQENSLKPSAQLLLSRAWKSIRALCSQLVSGKIVREGATFLLSQPEFRRDYDAFQKVIAILENEQMLKEAIDESTEDSVAVRIGEENELDALKDLAVITSKFYLEEQEAGTIAVIGPTRMDYDSTIALVREAAKALTSAISKLL